MKQYTQYIHKDDEWRILGGAQSDNADWNQNDDTKSDYIKNRTHYIEDSNNFTTTFTDVSFLNQVHYYINDGGVGGESSYAPKDGDIITFTINNHTYTEVLKIFGASSEEAVWSNDEPFYYIGNPSLFYSDTFFEDNKKPYFVYYTGTPGSAKWFFVVNETIINSTGTYNIDFSSLQNQNKQIDKTFLPYQKENNSIVLNNIETNIASGINSLAEGWNTAATGNAAHAEGYGYDNIPNKNNIWSLDIYTNNPAFILQGDNLNKTLTVIDITDFSHDVPKGSTLLAEWDSASSSGGNSGVRAAAQVFTLGKLKNTFYNSDENYWIYYLEDVPKDVDLSSFSVDFPPTTGAYVLGYEQIEYTDRPWAEGNYSHAEGFVTHAKGLGAHAEGNGTAALGDFSHAEGQYTAALGNFSHTGGQNTIAEYNYQTVIGKFNDNKSDTLFEVGKGRSNNLSNAFEVHLDGRATVGAAPVNNMDVATKKYVDDNFMSGMTILSYGNSTWADFIAAYTTQRVVYCRASSNSNPATGTQTRLAFMAYVNNAQDPTEVEFQYYRSVSSHSETQQGDQVYVYKLNKTTGWSVTTRECYTKIVGGTDITGTWSNGTLTLDHDNSGVSAGTYKSVTVDAKGHVTGGSNPTTLSGYGITDAKIASGTITLGSNTITPLTSSSTLDATKVSGTLPTSTYTDTKNTAGSTNTSSQIYLIGATSQAANPQTYSNSSLYFSSGLHSGVSTVGGSVNSTFSQTSNTTTISEDDSYDRGEFKVEVNSVKLSAKNYDNNKTSTVEVKSGTGVTISSGVGVTINNLVTPTNNTDAANKQYVDNAISSVTPTLPNASSTVVGGIKMRYDTDTYTLYITNDGTDA